MGQVVEHDLSTILGQKTLSEQERESNERLQAASEGYQESIEQSKTTSGSILGAFSASATYTAGNIATGHPFNSTTAAAGSACAAELTVNIPVGAIITGVDVSYNMTAAADGYISEQRSRIRVTNPGGVAESGPVGDFGYYRGPALASVGTATYTRNGLTIANAVEGGGDITFRMDAFRTWRGNTGTGNCGTLDNRVDNNSWTVTVHYDMPGALPNPSLFAATAVAPDQINLSWNLNEDEDDILLAWNTENTFGEPTGTYTPGASIAGGGTVLAVGGATSFEHTGLTTNTTYFYRIFSFNGDYSAGANASATTPLLVASYPFVETFENDSASRGAWSQIQELGAANWTFTNGAVGGTPTSAFQGGLNARFVSQNGVNSPVTKLVSPLLDLSSLTSPILSFFYAQATWEGDQNITKVYYRTAPDQAWVEIAEYSADTPNWTEAVLELPNPSSTYQFAFEGINNWGRANVIDLVTVDEAPEDPIFSVAASTPYTQIPLSLFSSSFPLQARVSNTGATTNDVIDVNFTEPVTSYSGTGSTTSPFTSGTSQIVNAAPGFGTVGVDPGSYTVSIELDTTFGEAENLSTEIGLTFSDLIYARDTGTYAATGVGSNSGAILFGTIYEIPEATSFSSIQAAWPINSPTTASTFNFSVYKLDGESLNIESTVLTTQTFTRGVGFPGNMLTFVFTPVTLEPGRYFVAMRQLTATNISIAYDQESTGIFYTGNNATTPTALNANPGTAFGNLAIRMDMTQRYVGTVTVLDETDAELEGATVTVFDDTDTQVATGTTSALGQFEAVLAPGSYTYNVSALGYEESIGNVLSIVDSNTSVSVSLDLADPTLSVTPLTHDFGTVNIGNTSAPRVFTITNTGGGTLTVLPADVTITGVDAALFNLTNLAESVTLATGQTATVSVTFSPLVGGAFEANLEVSSADGVDNQASVSLAGTGFDPTITDFPYSERFPVLPGDGGVSILPVLPGWTATGGIWNQRWQAPRIAGTGWVETVTVGAALFTPPFAIPAASEFTLSFWHKTEGATQQQNIDVYLSTDGGETYDVLILQLVNYTNTTYVQHTFDLSAYAGETIQIRFRKTGGNTTWGWAFDDLYIGSPTSDQLVGSEGFFLIANPLQQNPIGNLLAPFWTQGFPGSDYPTGDNNPQPNVFTFNEGATEEPYYIPVTSANNFIPAGSALTVYVYSDDNFDGVEEGFPKNISSVGVNWSGDISAPVTNNGSGFNLIGNPYGSAIDLANANDGDHFENLTGFFYRYNNSMGRWEVYDSVVDGVPDTFNGVINAFEGFFAHANAADPTFTFKEDLISVPILAQEPENTHAFITFNAESANHSGSTSIVFLENQTHGRDGSALLYPLTSEMTVLFTSKEESSFMHRYLDREFSGQVTIPMSYYTTDEGMMTINWTISDTMPEEWSMELVDQITGDRINIVPGGSYQFEIGDMMQSAPVVLNNEGKLDIASMLSNPVVKATDPNRFVVVVNMTATNLEPGSELPTVFALNQNYPNPFNPTTQLSYDLPESADVRLDVFNIQGQRVATLVNATQNAGRYNVTFDARNLASGVYIYRLQAGAHVMTKKMTLVK